AGTDRRAAKAAHAARARASRDRIRPGGLCLSGTAGSPGARRFHFEHRARRARGPCRALGRGQVDSLRAALALLRSATGRSADRRGRCARHGTGRIAAARRGGAAGPRDFRGERARQRPPRTTRCAARRSPRRLRARFRRGIHRAPAAGARHPARRARRDLVGRATPAPVDRPRIACGPANPAARRGDQRAGCRGGAPGAASPRDAGERAHHARDRASPRHGPARRPDRGHGARRDRRAGNACRADAPGRFVREPCAPAVPRRGIGPLGTRRLAALLPALAACSAAAQDAPRIGSKRFTESYILGEILAQVSGGEHRPGLGNTAILVEALRNGSIDVYPEYTGTIAREVLNSEERLDLRAINERLIPLGLAAGYPLGFANSYAIGMRRESAEKLAIKTISGLAKQPQLRIGLSHEFLGRRDGWPGLKSAYGLPQTPRGRDHGLAYEALAAGEIDAMDLYTTDAKIER